MDMKNPKLIVVDCQKGITDERLYNFYVFKKNVKCLITECRKLGVEVIYIQHDDGPRTEFSIGDDEFQIFEEFAPLENEKCFVKKVFSMFSNQELKKYLEESDTLIICGLQTNYCIDASIKSAFDLGYHIIIPKESNSTFDNDYMSSKKTYAYYNELMWPNNFGECMSVEEVLNMLKYSYGNN